MRWSLHSYGCGLTLGCRAFIQKTVVWSHDQLALPQHGALQAQLALLIPQLAAANERAFVLEQELAATVLKHEEALSMHVRTLSLMFNH